MKKLTLNLNIQKELLTKEQMRKISGGSTCQAGWYSSSCKVTTIAGSFSDPICAANANAAQAECDYVCWSNDWCLDCDCPGAD